MDILEHNACAWDEEVARGNPWTIPVDASTVARARQGTWEILLTPTTPVPRSWFGPLEGARVLCLASGGGQQGPILAAAGACVTVLDNSARQLEQDRLVARREDLAITTVQGDMADLRAFSDASFDLIVHPVSNCFVPDVRSVWREAHRVLREGGTLLAGFSNGIVYLFDEEGLAQGNYRVTYPLPYADHLALDAIRMQARVRERRPLEFGHTLTDQIGGQLDAGFVLCGFYEDGCPRERLSRYVALFAATRAVKARPIP
jgi:SAM-dependent methyltransferase